MLEFIIDGQPFGKERPRFWNGHAVTPPKTRAYEQEVGLLAKAAGAKPIPGPVEIIVDAFFKIPKSWSKKNREAAIYDEIRPTGRPDASNILKIVDDGCNGVAFVDDSQIVSSTCRKFYSEDARVQVRIEYLTTKVDSE